MAIIAATATQKAGLEDAFIGHAGNDADYPPLPKKKAGPKPRL
jgi:hypothetical protein